jgi:hypothetical protein
MKAISENRSCTQKFIQASESPRVDLIKDRGQVRSMWEWARDLDRQELLWFEFARPTEIDPGSPEDIAIQLTEGWILGSSPTVRRH